MNELTLDGMPEPVKYDGPAQPYTLGDSPCRWCRGVPVRHVDKGITKVESFHRRLHRHSARTVPCTCTCHSDQITLTIEIEAKAEFEIDLPFWLARNWKPEFYTDGKIDWDVVYEALLSYMHDNTDTPEIVDDWSEWPPGHTSVEPELDLDRFDRLDSDQVMALVRLRNGLAGK